MIQIFFFEEIFSRLQKLNDGKSKDDDIIEYVESLFDICEDLEKTWDYKMFRNKSMYKAEFVK